MLRVLLLMGCSERVGPLACVLSETVVVAVVLAWLFIFSLATCNALRGPVVAVVLGLWPVFV